MTCTVQRRGERKEENYRDSFKGEIRIRRSFEGDRVKCSFKIVTRKRKGSRKHKNNKKDCSP